MHLQATMIAFVVVDLFVGISVAALGIAQASQVCLCCACLSSVPVLCLPML